MKIVSTPAMMLTLLVAACGQSPVADNAAAPPDEVVGDIGANGLAAPANAAAAERAQKEPLPVPSDGMQWHWDAAEKKASFGPSVSAPALSIACNAGRIVVRRVDAAPFGAKGTISFTGNGHAASLPAVAAGSGLGSSWMAEAAPSDMTRAVATVFDGPAPVEVALTGTAQLTTLPSDIPARAFSACAS